MSDKKPTKEELKAMIEQERAERVQATQAEVNAVLQKYNTRIVPRCSIVENQVKQDLVIVANE